MIVNLRHAPAILAVAMLAITAGATEAAGPAFVSDREYLLSYALDAVHASAAYNRGFTGKGQTVAVFDTGLDAANREFTGKIATTGYDAISNTYGVTTDPNWHGTFVSGIIAAARNGSGMQGLAYDAQILSIRVGDANGSITARDANIGTGIAYAVQKGAIALNNSWNASVGIAGYSAATLNAALPSELANWRRAVNAGRVVVFAAGNDGKAEPGLFAALPQVFPELKKGWIAAVATDQTGKIASYSDRCGSASAWCMAAPGSNLVSTYKGGLATASGTSFAAPMISASVAILKQEYPFLTGDKIVQILFTTANKSGIYADKATYGQGMLDLDKATKPVGTTSLPTTTSNTGTAISLASSRMVVGGAIGASAIKSIANQSVLVVDDFGRGYTTTLAGTTTIQPRTIDVMALAASFGDAGITTQLLPDGKTRLSIMTLAGDGAASGDALPRFMIATESASGTRTSVEHGMGAAFAAQRADHEAAQPATLLMPDAVAIPYLALASRETAVQVDAGRIGGMTLSFGAFAGQAAATADLFAAPIDPSREMRNAVIGGLATLSTNRQASARGDFHVGAVNESGTLLGGVTEGAFALGSTKTVFAGFSGALHLGAGVQIFGGYDRGFSFTSTTSSSLVTGVSTLQSDALHIGVSASDLMRPSDRLAFVASQPLRVSSGSMAMTLPDSQDATGAISSRNTSSSLAAGGRETNLQLSYSRPLSDSASIALGGFVRLQPDNDASARPEAMALGRLKLAF